jgi:transcriptional regulator with XRE-family HTH domain
MATQLPIALTVKFPHRLRLPRKAKGYTQQSLADASGIHVQQITRYETRTAQPSVEALIKLARTLGASTDALLFDPDERGPDDDLHLQFEAVSRFDDDEKRTVRELLEGMIIKHDARRWSRASPSAHKEATHAR